MDTQLPAPAAAALLRPLINRKLSFVFVKNASSHTHTADYSRVSSLAHTFVPAAQFEQPFEGYFIVVATSTKSGVEICYFPVGSRVWSALPMFHPLPKIISLGDLNSFRACEGGSC